ncbi:MAG: FkbM family methyltransferase, partial [Pseudomonadota bacterium]
GPFVFVDAGANAGLYSLAARSAAVPGQLRLIAIEPEPETCARLRFNLAASGASPEASIVEAALAPEDGTLRLTAAGTNRGEVSVSAAGEGVEVAARTLHGIAMAEGLSRIDALKIDIEGAEAPVLAAFFTEADRALWPGLVIIEAPRGAETEALTVLCDKGYRLRLRTKLNAVLDGPGLDG